METTVPDPTDDHTRRQLASPTGQALQRMVDDPEFAQAVEADAPAALADYELDGAALAALAADASALAPPEVQGLDGAITRPELRTLGLLGLSGISSGDLGSGRRTGIAGGDLGSGRRTGIAGGDLGSGRFRDG